jgi:hypothetical protein
MGGLTSPEVVVETIEPSCYTYTVKGCRHCNENPIYVFPKKESRGLSPIFYIHVSVGDFYFSRIGPHIFLQHAE